MRFYMMQSILQTINQTTLNQPNMKKYTFKRYTDATTLLVWADTLFMANDRAGAGWNLFMIEK